jgi:hypothetical protein
MSLWTLEELVDSFSQSGGFWTQDALIVVANPDGRFTVIEGNRRLAALKLLYASILGEIEPPRWLQERLRSYHPNQDDDIFSRLPILRADRREDVDAYLGFRHVTGIKQWRPVEKAEFITKMVDENSMTFKEVAKQIGSRSDQVRQNYVAFKMLLQMEGIEELEWSEVEARFSVLFLSIRSQGTRSFLGVRLEGERPSGRQPVPADKERELRPFARWMFGDAQTSPVLKDSRDVDRFGEILGEPRAVEYLRSTDTPDFETAYSLTSASADLVLDPLRDAARHLRMALGEMSGRATDPAVVQESWPIIEGSLELAHLNGGENLARAREALLAA